MAYNDDLKIRAVRDYEKTKSLRLTAEKFSVSHDAVARWIKEFKEHGKFARKTQDRRHLRKITPEKIECFLAQNPNANQRDMARVFGCIVQSVSIALKKFGYSKKNSQSYTKNQIL